MMLLIGSRAAVKNGNFYRKPKDWDIIATGIDYEQFTDQNKFFIKYSYVMSPTMTEVHLHDGKVLKFELCPKGSSNEILMKEFCHDWACGREVTVLDIPIGSVNHVKVYVMPDVLLYLIKRSHIYWDIRWYENIEDLHWLKNQVRGQAIEDWHRAFYTTRLAESASRFSSQKKLDVTDDQFFNHVKRYFAHDTLHQLVRFGDKPVSEELGDPLTKARKDRFDDLPDSKKVQLVQEEAAVIALERYLIPSIMVHGGQLTPDINHIRGAYSKAMKRLCTDFTSGWFRDFAINSWPVSKDPGQDFFKKFKSALDLKLIQPLDERKVA